MAFVTKEEFQTHLYAEAQEIISRDDEEKINNALLLGQQIVESYLSGYDTATIFATTGNDRNPFQIITTYIKDIAKWHAIAVCNVTVDLELAERRYSSAIKELEKIQSGKTRLPNYPLAVNNLEPKPFRSGSRPKFNHSF